MSEDKQNGKGDKDRSTFSREYQENFSKINWGRMTKEKIEIIFQEFNFYCGRIISASKSFYLETYPDNLVVFNANVVTKKFGKIWHGDLDITLDSEFLKKIAEKIGEDLYVLREFDARFGRENDSPEELIKKAVWSTKND